jgi:dTDP-glucose 4,6-dehydratase
MQQLLITGGAGFIGSNFTRHMLEQYGDLSVVVYDKLTYAGNLDNLADVAERFADRYRFVHADIGDADAVEAAIRDHDIDTIVNFAAETHVDRSILEADAFIKTDIFGTYTLLEAARAHDLRLHQVSTDEVYGHVPEGRSRETDPAMPRSPYSASKAGADMLVHAYHVTYGVAATITRGSNNIGPYQYPEKVVPLFITNALDDIPLPLYGDGLQMRDYQYVLEHCEAIDRVLRHGELGCTYNVGTGSEMHNIDMARRILDRLNKPYDLIQYVEDRPGHDRRYALDISRLQALGWTSRHTPEEAIDKTVEWYVENESWWRKIKSGEYWDYYQRQYGQRAIIAQPGRAG